MQNYVISLKNASERRQHIECEFSKNNIEFNFFDAITPDKAKTIALEMKMKINAELLSQSELACLISHIELWKKIVNEKIPYTAIFEDDIFLGENAKKIFNQNDWLESDWDIIKVEYFYEKVVLKGDGKDLKNNDRKIHVLNGPNLGAAGYILSFNGAKMCLEYVLNHTAQPVDHLIFDKGILDQSLKVYQLNPAICIQETTLSPEVQNIMLSSSLFDERHSRMKTYKKRGWSKIKLEFVRILRQIRFALLKKTVSFK